MQLSFLDPLLEQSTPVDDATTASTSANIKGGKKTKKAAKSKKEVPTQTTAQRLSSIIKACRNHMRKDKGLSGDSDRLPMLTWIMFLKFLDDNEQIQEMNAQLEGRTFRPAIEAPYRWRDWAKDIRLSGDDLLHFINDESFELEKDKPAPGLFKYLRELQSETGTSRQDVIATVFKGVQNRMINGGLLRDVINEIEKIHFTNNEEVNTLSHLYESILKEMRDASGDAGEFYTPRPLVKFMVDVTNPQLGEVVLDPASGTGGFLVESFDHLKTQALSREQNTLLQRQSVLGGEAKPLPYLLCQMNLLLHGLEYPQIDPGNSLRTPLRDIGDQERVDIILTNPPFGGEEERSILNNFPNDKQTTETTLLFLQLIMRKLRRATLDKNGNPTGGGRAAVVVPNGTLFADGIAARIKEQLVTEFNLHTIIRLGEGVFAPYTDIPANVLFFEEGKPTDTIWYYELLPPGDRKKYSKTRPLQAEEFDALRQWWPTKIESEVAWSVNMPKVMARQRDLAQPRWDAAEEARQTASDLKARLDKTLDTKLRAQLTAQISAQDRIQRDNQSQGDALYLASFNLDIKNPNRKTEIEHRSPSELLTDIITGQQQILNLLLEIQQSTIDV